PPEHLRTDAAARERRVHRAGRLLRRRAARNGPGPDLVVANGEEGAQAEELVRRADETIERRLREPEILAERRRLVGRQLRDLGLELRGYRHDGARAMGLGGLADRRDDPLGSGDIFFVE